MVWTYSKEFKDRSDPSTGTTIILVKSLVMELLLCCIETYELVAQLMGVVANLL